MAKYINFKKFVEEWGEKAAQAAKEAIKENADTLLKAAQERCPVESGMLKASLHIKLNKNGTKAEVVADAKDGDFPYGLAVEYGYNQKSAFLWPAWHSKKAAMREHLEKKIRQALGAK